MQNVEWTSPSTSVKVLGVGGRDGSAIKAMPPLSKIGGEAI